MLELISLKFQGVGRFVEEQEIVLSGRPNVIGINALNKNTGGSSGGAKSTIFKAIDWLYGINEIPTTVLKSRYAKDMEVTGHFKWNGNPLTISRSTKNGLFIEWTDENGHHQISGNSALAEEKIDQILGISRDLFRLISHKRQGEMGFFLNLSPKESFEFLMTALGLKNWQQQLDKLTERISVEKQNIDRRKILLSVKQEEVKKLELTLSSKAQALEEAKSIFKNFSETAFTNNEANDKALLQEQIKQLTDKYKLDLASIVRPNRNDYVFTADPEILAQIVSIDQQIQEVKDQAHNENQAKMPKLLKAKEVEASLKSKIQEANLAKTKIASLEKEISVFNQKISTVSAGSCHICGQHWINDKSKQELAGLQDKLANLNKELEDNKAKLDIGDVEIKLKKLSEIIVQLSSVSTPVTKDLEQKKKSLENKLTEAKQAKEEEYTAALHLALNKTNEIESAFKNAKDAINSKIEAADAAQRELSNKKSYLETAIKIAEKEVATAEDAIKTANTELQDLENQLKNTQHQHDLADEARRAIKSYLMTVFQETLAEIGERASKTLSLLPNTNTATIYFEPFKEVTSGPNKGKVKEEVTAILSVDGEAAVPIKSVSGGERASIDLAVDLAVVDLVEEKGAVGTNYLILDEPCTGMDSVNKEQYVEILKGSGTKKKILIVDHSSEIKEMVDDTIVVIRDGLFSRIEEK